LNSFNLIDDIRNFINGTILYDSLIEYIRKKVVSGDGNKELGNSLVRLYELHKKSHFKMIEFINDNNINSLFNKKALHFILNGVLINALEHTDWCDKIYEETEQLPPVIIIESEENHNSIILRIANIPRDKKFLSDTENVFYDSKSIHLLNLGLVVELTTGGKNICCKEFSFTDQVKRVCTEIVIPKINNEEKIF
jgi:hypothetical protein